MCLVRSIRELAARESSGLSVRLLWHPRTNRIVIALEGSYSSRAPLQDIPESRKIGSIAQAAIALRFHFKNAISYDCASDEGMAHSG